MPCFSSKFHFDERKKQINESGSGHEHTPQPGDRQHNTPGFAVHSSEVHPCSHVQGEPWIFLHQQTVNSHTSLLTRQNAKAIWCPHFYSQFCYKFAHFSEDGLFLFPEHSITVTSGTENHFDKCPIYREMNSHKGDQFFFLFFFLSFTGEGNS